MLMFVFLRNVKLGILRRLAQNPGKFNIMAGIKIRRKGLLPGGAAPSGMSIYGDISCHLRVFYPDDKIIDIVYDKSND